MVDAERAQRVCSDSQGRLRSEAASTVLLTQDPSDLDLVALDADDALACAMELDDPHGLPRVERFRDEVPEPVSALVLERVDELALRVLARATGVGMQLGEPRSVCLAQRSEGEPIRDDWMHAARV